MSRVSTILSGVDGGPDFDFRLYRSDETGAELEELPNVESASVNLSNYRDHTWELSVPLSDAKEWEVFGRYAKLVVLLRDGAEWLRYPMGLYLFDSPRGTHGRLATDLNLAAKSPESVLMEGSAYRGYGVPAGTGVLAAVRAILLEQGVPPERINLPTGDKPLATAFYASPYEDLDGVRWLRICNALLAAGGFYALYCDNAGRFTTKEIEELSAREPAVIYGSTEGSERLVVGDVPFEYDGEGLANRVVVYSGDPNESPPLIAVAELRSAAPSNPAPGIVYLVDPDSRVSVDALGGRVIQREPVELQNLVSVAEARRVALSHLRAAANRGLRWSLSTVLDPRRGPREVYGMDLSREDGTVLSGERWWVTGWGFSVENGVPSAMEHEISRLVAA